MALKLITPPEPLYTAQDAITRLHLRVDSSDDNALIDHLIKTATEYKEQETGRAFVAQTWELALDAFPTAEILLPKSPIISVTSIKYDDADGVEATVDPADYQADIVSPDGWVVLSGGAVWPVTLSAINAARVRFVAGYGAPDDVPAPLKQSVLVKVAELYENREETLPSNMTQSTASAHLSQLYRRMFV